MLDKFSSHITAKFSTGTCHVSGDLITLGSPIKRDHIRYPFSLSRHFLYKISSVGRRIVFPIPTIDVPTNPYKSLRSYNSSSQLFYKMESAPLQRRLWSRKEICLSFRDTPPDHSLSIASRQSYSGLGKSWSNNWFEPRKGLSKYLRKY